MTDGGSDRARVDDQAAAPSEPPLRTTVVIALADPARLAEIEAAAQTAADLEVVATTSRVDQVHALARSHVPGVLVIDSDLFGAPDLPADEPPSPVPLDPGKGSERRTTTDLRHPVAAGLRSLCRAVHDELPAIRLVVTAPDGVHSYGAVLGGAIGCVPPEALAERIVEVTRRVAWGEGILTQEWARAVLADLGGRTTDRTEAGPMGRPALDATELEVLRRTASGATSTEIAAHHAVPERDVNRRAASALVKARRLHADYAIATSVETGPTRSA